MPATGSELEFSVIGREGPEGNLVTYPADDLPPVDLQLAKEYEDACRIIYSWAPQIFQDSE